ncbi:MAG: hypothetical protein GY937_29060 [bacterium]|nr:hypothetical protein [bacterium]
MNASLRWGIWSQLGPVIASFLLACQQAPPTIPEPPETRATMAEIVAALQVALPLSLSADAFSAPENQDALDRAVAQLSQSTGALEAHGMERDAGFAHMSHALSRDSAEIQWRLEQGRTEEARFLLGELVNDCVACHSRLPSTETSDLGRSLYEAVDTSGLARSEQVRLEIATRQFDRALASLESLIADPTLSPSQLDLGGFLSDYLRVSIRVRADLARPRITLDRWQHENTLPAYLDHLATNWIDALATLRVDAPPGMELEEARSVASQAGALRRFPADRATLVHDLVVSSLLNRALARQTLAASDNAEAYYLLGLAELRVAHSYWLAAPEAYLEAAIRTAPGSAFARQAYLVLEEETIAGYTGSGGTQLPAAVATWLDELRELALADR